MFIEVITLTTILIFSSFIAILCKKNRKKTAKIKRHSVLKNNKRNLKLKK